MRILNSKGEQIVLNEKEKRLANNLELRLKNELGFKIDVTTMTTIMKKVVEQKFFEIAPADYLPVRVGEGAWSSSLETFRSFALGEDFEKGIINQGNNNARLATADAGVDSVNIKVINWAKSIGWNLFELQEASRAGNWDLVTAKEKSRKKNWDLGIQRVAFLGTRGNANSTGLYAQAGTTINTTLITKQIKAMTPTELKTFLAGLVSAYRTNCSFTAWPTHFIIPEDDYLGLASQSSPDFPMKSVLELIIDALKTLTRNPEFKVLPNAYGSAANSGSVLSTDRYVMLNYDEDSLRMDIPVDYTNTLANSVDNFTFQNVGYGQFTGVLAYRPKELLYFDLTT
jgi:hypothetical protein